MPVIEQKQRYSDDQLRKAKEVDLPALISGRVEGLRRAGQEWQGLCPLHDEKSPSFTLYRGKDSRWRWHCFGCGSSGDAIGLFMHLDGLDFGAAVEHLTGDKPVVTPRPARPQSASPSPPVEPSEAALAMWRAAAPANGTPVETYLRYRGLPLGEGVPPSLRYAVLKHTHDGKLHPVMLAGVQDRLGKIVAVHRTYLAPGGKGKAQMPKGVPVKMMLGPVRGAAVRLSLLGENLVFGEGIETMLAVLAGKPNWSCWAALSASNLLAVAKTIPRTVRRIIVASDSDPVGLQNSADAVEYLQSRGRNASRIAPSGVKDFCDLLQVPHGG